jgi:hypothetical protein
MSETTTSTNLKASKEAKGGSSFEKHTPVYPLPNEILTMSRDETICQFCGVSYLIHNEIKKLEERIKVKSAHYFAKLYILLVIDILILYEKELESNLIDYKSLKLKEKQYEQINEENRLKIQTMEEKLITMTQM